MEERVYPSNMTVGAIAYCEEAQRRANLPLTGAVVLHVAAPSPTRVFYKLGGRLAAQATADRARGPIFTQTRIAGPRLAHPHRRSSGRAAKVAEVAAPKVAKYVQVAASLLLQAEIHGEEEMARKMDQWSREVAACLATPVGVDPIFKSMEQAVEVSLDHHPRVIAARRTVVAVAKKCPAAIRGSEAIAAYKQKLAAKVERKQRAQNKVALAEKKLASREADRAAYLARVEKRAERAALHALHVEEAIRRKIAKAEATAAEILENEWKHTEVVLPEYVLTVVENPQHSQLFEDMLLARVMFITRHRFANGYPVNKVKVADSVNRRFKKSYNPATKKGKSDAGPTFEFGFLTGVKPQGAGQAELAALRAQLALEIQDKVDTLTAMVTPLPTVSDELLLQNQIDLNSDSISLVHNKVKNITAEVSDLNDNMVTFVDELKNLSADVKARALATDHRALFDYTKDGFEKLLTRNDNRVAEISQLRTDVDAVSSRPVITQSSLDYNNQQVARIARGLSDVARLSCYTGAEVHRLNGHPQNNGTLVFNGNIRTIADANFAPAESRLYDRSVDILGIYGAPGSIISDWRITPGSPVQFPSGGSLVGTSPAAAAVPGASISWRSRVPSALPAGLGIVWVNNKDDLCTVHAYKVGTGGRDNIDINALPKPPRGGFAPQDFLNVQQLAEVNVWQNDHWLNPNNPEPKVALLHTQFEDGSAHYDALMPLFEGHPAFYPQGKGAYSVSTGMLAQDGITRTFYPNGAGDDTTLVMVGTGLPIEGDNTSQGHITIVDYDKAFNHLTLNPSLVIDAVGSEAMDVFSIFNVRDWTNEGSTISHNRASESIEVVAQLEITNQMMPAKGTLSYSAAGSMNRILYGSNVGTTSIVVDTHAISDSIRTKLLPQMAHSFSKEAAAKISNVLSTITPIGSESLAPLLERLWRMYFSLALGSTSVASHDIMGNVAFLEQGNRRNVDWQRSNTTFAFGTNPLQSFSHPYLQNAHDSLSSFMGGNINQVPVGGHNPLPGYSGLFPESAEHWYMLMTNMTFINGEFPYLILPYGKMSHRFDSLVTNRRSMWTVFNLVTEPNCGIAPTTHLTGNNRFTDGWGNVVQHDAFVHGLDRVQKILFMSPYERPRSLSVTNFTAREVTCEAVMDAIAFIVHNYEAGRDASTAFNAVIRDCFKSPHIAATELPFDMGIRFNAAIFHNTGMKASFIKRISAMRVMDIPDNWGPAAQDDTVARFRDRFRQSYAGVDARNSLTQLSVAERDSVVEAAGLEHDFDNYTMAGHRAALHDSSLFEADLLWYEATRIVPWFINSGDAAHPIVLNHAAIDEFICSMPTARMNSLIEWLHDEGNNRVPGNNVNVFGNRWQGALANTGNEVVSFTMVMPNNNAVGDGSWDAVRTAIHAGFYRNRELDIPITNLYSTRREVWPTGLNLLRSAIATNIDIGRDTESTQLGTILRFLSSFSSDAGTTGGALPGVGTTTRDHVLRRVATLALSLRALTDSLSMEQKFNVVQLSAHEGELLTTNVDIDFSWQTRAVRSHLLGERRPLHEYIANFAVQVVDRFKSFGFVTTMLESLVGQQVELHVPRNQTLWPELNVENNYGDKTELAAVNWVCVHPVLAQTLHYDSKPTIGMVSWVPAFANAYLGGVQQPWANWAIPNNMDRRGVLGLMRIYALLTGYNYHVGMSLAISNTRGSAKTEHYPIMRRLSARQSILSDSLPYGYQNSLDILWFIDPVLEPYYDAGYDREGKQLLTSDGYRLTMTDIIPWQSFAAPRLSGLPGLSIYGLGTTERMHNGDYYSIPFGKKYGAFYPVRHVGWSSRFSVTMPDAGNNPAGIVPVGPPRIGTALVTTISCTLTQFGSSISVVYAKWTGNGLNMISYTRAHGDAFTNCIRPLEKAYLINNNEDLLRTLPRIGDSYRGSVLPVGLAADDLKRADLISWSDTPDRTTAVNSINKFGTALTRLPIFASADDLSNNTCRMYSPYGKSINVLAVANPSRVWTTVAQAVYMHLDSFVYKYRLNAPVMAVTQFGARKAPTILTPQGSMSFKAKGKAPTSVDSEHARAGLYYMPGGVGPKGTPKPAGARPLPAPPAPSVGELPTAQHQSAPTGQSAADDALAKSQKALDKATLDMQTASDKTDKLRKLVEDEQEKKRKAEDAASSTAGANANIQIEAAPQQVGTTQQMPSSFTLETASNKSVQPPSHPSQLPPSPPLSPQLPPVVETWQPAPLRPKQLPSPNPVTPEGIIDIEALNTMPAMRLNIPKIGMPHASAAWLEQNAQLRKLAASTGGSFFG